MCLVLFGSRTDTIDLGSNPNLLTLSLEIDLRGRGRHGVQPYLIFLSGLAMPNLQQVTLGFLHYTDFLEWNDWLEIDGILNGLASVRFVEILLDADPTATPTFIEYSPLLWSRGILKITFLPLHEWPIDMNRVGSFANDTARHPFSLLLQ
jgi:hypothetical protein